MAHGKAAETRLENHAAMDVAFEDVPSSPEGEDDPSQDGRAGGEPSVRAKRIACIICRRRKLRCDGEKPACGTCARLGHRCGYDEVRRKSGPKRGYVKELEARLKIIESQLKSKQNAAARLSSVSGEAGGAGIDLAALGMSAEDIMRGFNGAGLAGMTTGMGVPNVMITSELDGSSRPEFPWEMIGLGLEEPLPPQDMIDELHQIYFDKLHYSMPMIHKYRYLAAMNLAAHMRPSICLRYAIWAMTCSVAEKYFSYAETFYARARKYAEGDEMKGHGESMVTVGHCQAWILIALFEFKNLFFPRAWMSVGRAVRLGTMLGLNRQDGAPLEVKQTLKPPRDWADREERRRTFWMTYCVDKYASIGTGWPMSLEEADIATNLPASNEDFEKNRAVHTSTLEEAMNADGASQISSFGGVIVMACVFGKNLTHLHRTTANDMPEEPTGEFWKRHQYLDNVLVATGMYLPDHMRLPAGIRDPNVVAVNMYLHSATICLHQAAILKAAKHLPNAKIVRDSTHRCYLAASELVSLTKLCSPIDMAYMNPFASFCLYVGARIFAHSYMKHPDNEHDREQLNFLLSAMQAHRSKNNLTESFLVQLQVELDAAGLPHPLHNRNNYRGSKTTEALYEEAQQCPPVFPKQKLSQPTYSELQSNGGSPPVVRSGMHSPQMFGNGTFSVTSRDRPNHLTPQSTPAAATLPSQNWGEQTSAYSPSGSNEPAVFTPPHSNAGNCGSSSQSYSPNPGDDPGSSNGGIALPPAAFYSQPNPNYTAATDFHVSHHAYYGANYANPSHNASEHGVIELPADWNVTGGIPGLGDASWGPVLEGMNWEHGGGMPQSMG